MVRNGMRRYADLFVPGVLGLAILGLAVVRLMDTGWVPLTIDDARYLYVGLATFDGHGPVSESGAPYLARSPAFGMMLALGGRILPTDPITSAHLVTAALSIVGLLLAVAVGWLLAGRIGAVSTAVAVVAAPLGWELLPTLRVDPAVGTGILATLIALSRPTPPRWLLAGLLLGFTVLVKETVGLAVIALPLAWLPALPRDRWLPLSLLFVVAAAAVAAPWWAYVWSQSGTIFPLGSVETATVDRVRLEPSLRVVVVGAVVAAGWAGMLLRARSDTGARLLIAAGLALLPPSLIAFRLGYNERQYAPIALLTCIAIGASAAAALRWVWARPPVAGRPLARTVLVAASIAVIVGGLFGVQAAIPRPEPVGPHVIVVDWLRPRVAAGHAVVANFAVRSIVGLGLYGRARVDLLPVHRIPPSDDPRRYLWIGLRGTEVFGLPRSGWQSTLTGQGVRYLVIAGPHPLAPAELRGTLDRDAVPGVRHAATFGTPEQWAVVYAIDSSAVEAPPTIATHASADAVVRFLQIVDNRLGVIRALAAGRAVVSGTEVRLGDLAAAVRGEACLEPAPSPEPTMAVIVVVASGGECPDG